MDQEERQRKLEAGRAKLAHFRQRRAKDNGVNVTKKTQKKKTNVCSVQDCHLEQTQTGEAHEQNNKDGLQELLPLAAGDQASCQFVEMSHRADAQRWHALPGNETKAEQPVDTADLLGEVIVTHTSKEQLKQLQAAVKKRNEIISQLSVNLQVALSSRDQVQLEAQQLTGQIQELQQQLQHAKEYLRQKSLGWLDLSQAQKTQRQLCTEELLQMTKAQQCVLDQKETEIATLQQKLVVMENSLFKLQNTFTLNRIVKVNSSLQPEGEMLSDTDSSSESNLTLGPDEVLQRLRSELHEERQNSQRVKEQAESLQKMVSKLESQKAEMESHLASVQADLERAERQALEMQQYKAEKEQLNLNVARLDGLVHDLQNKLLEEEETGKQLRSKYEAEIANYELRLQTLEEEGEMNVAQLAEAHEVALKRLQENQSKELGNIQELLERALQHNHSLFREEAFEEPNMSLNCVKPSKEKRTHVRAKENVAQAMLIVDSSVTEDQNDLMEKYLASAVQRESSWIEQSLEERSLIENFTTSNFVLESKIMLAESRLSIHHDSNHDSDHTLSLQPDTTEDQLLEPNGISLTQAQWQSFSSTSKELNESVDYIDLGKELLIQQCRDLTEQLEEKEKQLEILQEEVQRSAEELVEARDRWSKASEDLEEAKWELESEQGKRVHCQELISQQIHEQDNLKNKLSYLESQLVMTPHSEKNSGHISTEELLKELKEEKLKLVFQLKQQEQLVMDIQERKNAGDLVSSEVQALFGRQLSSLQVQRDQLLAEVENQREKNLATSVLLGQKTLEVDSANEKIQELQVEIEENVEALQKLENVKVDLESEVICLKDNLSNLQEALVQKSVEKTELELRLHTLNEQMMSMEKVLERELEDFELQLEEKNVALEQMKEANEKAAVEHMEKESALQNEVTVLQQSLKEHLREQEEFNRTLEEKHQKEVQGWSVRLEKELSMLRLNLENEQKKQIGLVKQVHEREHHRELAQQAAQQREELGQLKADLSEDLRDSIEAAHQAELLQAQTQKTLELEALRLSLTNLHTTQLELIQANLQKEKEAALSELQACLREKWAQESAMLQTRQQFELERLREQGRELERQAQIQHQQEIADLKFEWEKRISEERISVERQQASKLEELQAALNKVERSLAETQHRLEELQRVKEQDIQHLETELNQAWSDRDSAARAVEDLVASHKVVLLEQQTHAQNLEQKEKQLQQEVDRLLKEQEAQKVSSEQEISNLWSQLDCMRTSRQELGELKLQLLERTSRVDDIERLKQEFSQQRRELQGKNEVELENLRTYFEQRLQVSEENHREEIALLQLRLVEGALEESTLKTEESSFLSDGKAEKERDDALAEIMEQLEKHKMELHVLRLQLEEKHKQDLEQLRCSMALSYKEELLQARTELTDRYYSEIDQLKNKHALDIEQQRAKLSDSHLKEITKLRLQSAAEVARQVEADLEERTRVFTKEHQAQLAQLTSETEHILKLEKQLAELTLQHIQELEQVTKHHTEELRKLEERLQKKFAEDMRMHIEEAKRKETHVTQELSHRSNEKLLELREQLEAQNEDRMAALREELIQAALEERTELEQKLAQTHELLAAEQQRLHLLQTSLDSGESPQVVAMKQKLEAQYKAEMHTAKSTMAAEVKELNALMREQNETRSQEAQSRHQEELRQQKEQLAQELENQGTIMEQHISKLQQLQKEYQELKSQHQQELDLLAASHKASVDLLKADLSEQHRAELDKLQVILEETNIAQLEAQEAQLLARHNQELDELETRMSSNVDTVETTYIKEIQAVREEKEDALRQLRALLEQQHAKAIEKVRAEELSVRDKLRRELAQTHMDKFTAMASELGHAHQAALSLALASQKAALDSDHHSTLETLQKHVLDLEKQHNAALQEVTDLTTTENQRLQQQLEVLTAQHQQLLQELKIASAREMEALQRELEEEASRQRLHFLEEAELLKSNSEEQLQKKITQIKEECENEKDAALETLKRSLQEQRHQDDLCYKDQINLLNTQLKELDNVVSKLQAEVSSLQEELEGKCSEMETLETLLQRRERESQEGANLLTMLRDDLNTATQQRQNLQLSRDQLQHLLLEILRSTISTEEHISHKLGVCLPGGCTGDCTSKTSNNGCDKETEVDSLPVEGAVNCSMFSSVADEGLELSQRLCESLFTGAECELDPEREELVLGTCNRLRTAVDKLLEMVSQSTLQMEQMQALQRMLDEQFSEGGEARNALIVQHTQLLEQLDQEASLKSRLQLKLHKAEGLMEGYVAEKAALEEALEQKEVREQRLVKELESSRAQLQELGEEHTLLQRQRDALSTDLGDSEKGFPDGEEKALLAEAERLGQERVDLQRQAEKDRMGLATRLRLLELALEEHENRAQQQEEQHRVQTEDLQQHIDALEKQLKHHRQFMDEQAVEREHERDEFQQEIKNLEAQLKIPTKGYAGGDKGHRIEDLVIQVESLQALINDKAEDYSVLLSAKEQCQQDLEERNEEIEKMACRIRELEQALLSSAEAGRAVTQLEQELQRAQRSLQELSEDKEALQQQLYSNKLQISALQSKLDETRHRFPDPSGDTGNQEQLEILQQDLQSKKQQVEALMERVEELEKALVVKEEDIRQLTLQLELKTQESKANTEQLQLHITELQDKVNALRKEQPEQGDNCPLQLSTALLEEKNQEIDHLNDQILCLQQERDTTKENKIVEEKQAEIEELHAQVERLHSDQERLRQAKNEEAEQLHEVIHKLQEELSQLDPNRHEVSDPNPDSPEPSDFTWSSRKQHGTEESLCHELSSQTLQSCHTKLQELQVQLEHTTEEKEALQRLLLSQEQQCSEQIQAMGCSLGKERGRLAMLEQEAGELKLQLIEREAEVEKLQAHVQTLEDKERTLKDLDLTLRKAEEKKMKAQQELARLGEQAQKQKEEREKMERCISELKQRSEKSENTAAELRVQVSELKKKLQLCKSDRSSLEMGKEELCVTKETLQKREGVLQKEIERLKQEVQIKNMQIQELNVQLEHRVAELREAQKDVLTCAEETLGSAAAALLEREEQLTYLRVEHDALRVELASVKEGLSTSTERAEKLREEGQFKDRALADLEDHNQHLRAELRSLQDDLEVQEEELAYQQRELDELRLRCNHQEHNEHQRPKPDQRFLDGLSGDASLSSPEVLRQLDCSQEPQSHYQTSHLSVLSGLRNTSLELDSKHSPVERNTLQQPLMQPSGTDPPSTHSPSVSPHSFSMSENLSVLDSLDADKVQELENLDDVTLCSNSPVSMPEWASDGYGSNVSSELEAKLKLELEQTERLDAHFVQYLRDRGMSPAPHSDSAAGSLHNSPDKLSPELQAMLNRVYQESCKVLSLSRRPAPAGQPHQDSEQAPPLSWQSERRALQGTVLSLRELLCRMAEHEPKAGVVDWRRELLEAVRSVFASERDWFHARLQDVMATNTCIDHESLLKCLEKLLQKQGEQQRQSLEGLLNADRSSLLTEIRSLHGQLHSCTLQSQEHLRELQSSLHKIREQGAHTQQQLHRQVNELEKQLQQEQMMSNKLRSSLEEERTRLTEHHNKLEAEKKVVSELRVELEEHRLQMHSASKTQEELQNQLHKLRMKLDEEKQEHQACVEGVEREQARVIQLQEEVNHERLNSKHAQEENLQTQESLRASLREHTSRLNELSYALNQEHVVVSNLRAELQIEQSRCEALLAQEHERTELALSQLDEERSRTAELSRAFSHQTEEHTRQLEEAACTKEAASALDKKFIQTLQAQLKQERSQAEGLAAMLERLQAQVLEGKRRQEEEAQREQDEVRRLHTAVEGLQAQRLEVSRNLEAERQRASELQKELDAMKQKMREVKEKERAREEQREKQRWREKQEQEEKERRQGHTNEKLLKLEALRERDQQRMRQLQQTLADLEQQEKHLTSERLQRDLQTSNSTHISYTQGSPSSSSSSLLERVLKENSELAERLAALSEEKISLKHTLSSLERDLHNLKCNEQEKSSTQLDPSILAEKLIWQKEKATLQAALHKAEDQLTKATSRNENRPITELSNSKVQRLYERYLRAESYRKSLVYQKRYLLLLLGGFQDCEQATLALIARMGANPSLSHTQTSRPISRFRSVVRVLIAVSRLQFLTRKWQKATKKLLVGSASAAVRLDVLKPQQTGAAYNSPPTRDQIFTPRSVVSPLVSPIKSPFRLHNRSYQSNALTPSQDQERSLDDYINHLEMVQQRLGAVRPGSPSRFSYPRRSDR